MSISRWSLTAPPDTSRPGDDSDCQSREGAAETVVALGELLQVRFNLWVVWLQPLVLGADACALLDTRGGP